MSRYSFELATEADDAELRRRMAEDRMEGRLTVSFRREPSYFAGCRLQGENVQVIKCVDTAGGRIVGLGSRSCRMVFLNGEPRLAGYLADLRAHPSVRRGTLLARGFHVLRRLHQESPVPLYYTMILETNAAAVSALTSARAGLPRYRPLGRFLTPAIHLDFDKRPVAVGNVRFERARADQMEAVFSFVRGRHREKQLAPLLDAGDLGSPRLANLRCDDFYVATRNGSLVGALAAWDQRSVRQTCLERYSPSMAAIRPFYNWLARLTPLKRLPEPGSSVPYFYLACAAVEDDNVDVFRGLLRFLYRDRRAGLWHYFIAGLHERDPLAAVLSEYRRVDVAGLLFVVHYEDGERAFQSLDGRVPYVEIGTI